MEAEDKLKWLFEPCQTADELDKYLRYWLKLDLPWDVVDPESTSSPLKFIWKVYKIMLSDNGPHTHILASSRNCMKTLTSSTLQFLSMLHFRRDGVHIAATLDQSSQAILYLDGFMNIPELTPYQNKDNVKIKQFIGLPANSLTDKADVRLKVVTATKKGANSARASFLTFDEVDLTPQQILDEAAWIADPTRDKNAFSPIFVYLSSRKTNDGPVQNLLDKAEKENSGDEMVHKWSATDFMKKCEPEVHKPELGKQMAYVHAETLQIIWGKEKFESVVAETVRTQYKEYSAFEGCKTCPAFIPCLGFSANQRGESKALRTVKFTSGVFKKISDPAVVISQGLNWRPEVTALVFRNFSRFKHLQDPIDFYQWVCGRKFNPLRLSEAELETIEKEGDIADVMAITPTKADIYDAMVAAGWTMVAGTDWGFTDPAVTPVIGFHKRWKRCAVLTLASETGFANHLWAEHVAKHLLNKFPVEWMAPDMADPASPTYFSKWKIMSLDTKPTRIEPGVSFIRGLLWNAARQTVDFAILDDSQMDNKNIMMVEAMEHWTHKKTPLGFDMNKFEDNEWTHPLDALRYALTPFQEEIAIRADVKIGPSEINLEVAAAAGNPEAMALIKQKGEMMNQLSQHMQDEHGLQNIFGTPGDYSAVVLDPKNNPHRPQPAEAPKKPGGGGGVKFKF